MVSVGGMTARGASALLFLLVCMLWVAPFGAPVGVAVKKWWRGRLPPAAPCGGRGLGWRAPPPALLNPPASPPPTAGRACAPPCGGRRLALAAAAMIQWGGGAAAARPLWGGAPLSGGCGGACRVWGWGGGLLSWRRRGLGRSAPLHSKPPAPPRPQSPPPCACGRGVGVPLATASGDGRPLSRADLRWNNTSSPDFPYKCGERH